jgi:hypothetical protein
VGFEKEFNSFDVLLALGNLEVSFLLDEVIDVVLKDFFAFLLIDCQESLLVEILNLLTDLIVLSLAIQSHSSRSLTVPQQTREDDALTLFLQHLHLLLFLPHFLDEFSKHLLFLVHSQLYKPIFRLPFYISVGIVPLPSGANSYLAENIAHQSLRFFFI